MVTWGLAPPPSPPDPVPGQMYVWTFDVLDGTWPMQLVTEEGRNSFYGAYSTIEQGACFIIITVDDQGPPRPLIPDYDDHGDLVAYVPQEKRWHVVLTKDKLFWFEHDWLSYAKLVEKCD